jgi:hypothetical protein
MIERLFVCSQVTVQRHARMLLSGIHFLPLSNQVDRANGFPLKACGNDTQYGIPACSFVDQKMSVTQVLDQLYQITVPTPLKVAT